ncbi:MULTISPECIES: sodium:proton antiporter [Thermotoga]|uniref:NADH-ubiquinone oxidoreductase chain 4L n=1 Tax=Thermotoga neapolitana (strain ATCC 49049 / DSM 4359 / NBRC 107923 / NS-E) TaxID=309803 RepID=B9K9A4_THENN|nr:MULTISPECIES: sodium:proton antiporter [Thermotoga]ACM23537.1 NADH-ubiquinone oxidoreductase chain 4L [Thermotoga neapolitana DSM 4359]AJG41439.1 monovalent cation/H+ antiporter subunit C [Thermotoga sp. RQ7]MDK2786277.1 multicomponent Na+:H+ antiporter subunit [Thermotoga sp.]HBF10578.1 cation:proton antiporter [Thermotoga neapolitana]
MVYMISIILMGVGVYGLLTQKNLFKHLVSLTIIDTAVNIFIIALGYTGGEAPIYTEKFSYFSFNFVDPLPQALVLTAIVIGVGVLALGASLLVRIKEKHSSIDIEDMKGVKE